VQFVEAARNFAQRIILECSDSPEERIRFAYQWATSRSPTPDETVIVKELLDDNLAYFTSDSEAAVKLLSVGESKRDDSLDAAEHASWTMVASTLLNLDETVTKQ
jgi:hypothetical protein